MTVNKIIKNAIKAINDNIYILETLLRNKHKTTSSEYVNKK